MALSHRNIFLIDGLGAILSAFMLSVVLTYFESLFGMPHEVLKPLAVVACIFSMYSLTCHFNAFSNWQPLLKLIAISNTIFCLVSIGFVVYYFEKLTSIGICYFVLEVIVVGMLVFTEFRIALQGKSGGA
jgi:hypothetical protein